jgi:hypothetical protein
VTRSGHSVHSFVRQSFWDTIGIIALGKVTTSIEEVTAMQPEFGRTLDVMEPGHTASEAAERISQAHEGKALTSPPHRPERDPIAKSVSLSYPEPPAYFGEVLDDAERLLKYAAARGIGIDDKIRNDILQARAASRAGWNPETAASLLSALGKLAAQLKPVTAESLKACTDGTRATFRRYWVVAICLAIVIVPFSMASFVASAISSAIRTDITTANDLSAKLRAQLGPPPKVTKTAASTSDNSGVSGSSASASVTGSDAGVIAELQQFATTIRAIDARARQLNVLVLGIERDPFANIRKDPTAIHNTFELPKGLPNFAVAAADLTTVYQNVRYFAQSLIDDVSFFYGAISACLLPVLYALLGTCAYLLRSFEQQMTTRTFTPSIADSARFLVAAIGGAVVGLFNNFTITQGASIPPLAFAFLVGYAVDVFFVFLEGVLQAFTKGSATSPTPSSGGKA